MKNVVLMISIIITLNSCSSNLVQVFETKASNAKIVEDKYIFENDSVKIVYDFWKDKGLMNFSIENKLNKPLYIDWTKCSYINNTFKSNYWDDEENSLSVGQFIYTPTGVKSVEKTKMTKPEKIAFIPPNSKFIKNRFYILPIKYLKVNQYSRIIEITSTIDSKKKTQIKEKEYDKNSTPLTFRNYITLSYTEDFKNQFYIDNEFYISKVTRVDENQFEYYERDPSKRGFYLKNEFGERILKSPYKKGTSFYISIKVN